MLLLIARIHNFLKSEKGQGMVEYGLILGLVSVVVIGILTTMGGSINTLFGKASSALSGAGQ